MRYLLALIVPPLAVLLCGKPVKALLNLLLWFLGIVPGVIHAILVINEHKADLRMKRQTDALIKAHRQQPAK